MDISNVGLLYRLRQCGDWLALLVGQLLAAKAPPLSKGRLIRIIDATTVLKAGEAARRGNRLWRIHSAFDLPAERFGQFELTDEHGGEQIERIAVVRGEIRIGDAVYMQPDRIAEVQAQGGDILVRSGWRNARWLHADGEPFDILSTFRAATTGVVDCPVWVGRKHGTPWHCDWWRYANQRQCSPKRGEKPAGRRKSRAIMLLLLLEPRIDALEDSPRSASAG